MVDFSIRKVQCSTLKTDRHSETKYRETVKSTPSESWSLDVAVETLPCTEREEKNDSTNHFVSSHGYYYCYLLLEDSFIHINYVGYSE